MFRLLFTVLSFILLVRGDQLCGQITLELILYKTPECIDFGHIAVQVVDQDTGDTTYLSWGQSQRHNDDCCDFTPVKKLLIRNLPFTIAEAKQWITQNHFHYEKHQAPPLYAYHLLNRNCVHAAGYFAEHFLGINWKQWFALPYPFYNYLKTVLPRFEEEIIENV